MGVATVTFPQGLEISNFFWRAIDPLESIGEVKPLL